MKITLTESSMATKSVMLQKILKSALTSASSPAEVLKQLSSYGIEWYLTEKGTLAIKYWQIGAEDFVRPEQVAALREGSSEPPEADALEWVSKNLPDLRNQYPGKWVAVVDNWVACSADDLPSLMRQLSEEGVERPFITQIPTHEIVWTTTYAYKGL